jgi:hypothetical protein
VFSAGNLGRPRRLCGGRHLLSVDRNRIREPDLTKLRELPRGEAIRVAMLLYGWDAAIAAKKVDFEQGRYTEEIADQNDRQSA